jgi:hypothetical protein
MKITDFDGITGEKVEREATPEEMAEIQEIQDAAEAQASATADKAEAKEALLAKLGITAEEAALLLG